MPIKRSSTKRHDPNRDIVREHQSRHFIGSIITWIATGFYCGLIPFAPGTFGALWGVPLAWLILQLDSVIWQLLVIGALVFSGIPICTIAARRLGKKDPGAVVWDEIVTVPIVFLCVDRSWMSRPGILLLGFALHRFFDITKPPPIRRLEKLPDGVGIMSDDVVAAGYAWLVLQGLIRLASSLFAK